MNLHGGLKKMTQLFFVEKALYVRRAQKGYKNMKLADTGVLEYSKGS